MAVAVVGYDLCPIVTIADIIEQIRRACIFLWQRFGRRMLVTGHSAGGHLAAAMVATDWHALYPKAPADLVPAGYAISGVFDLTPLVGFGVNQDLRLDADDARRVSPLFWPVPPGRVLDAAVGDLETERIQAPEPGHGADLGKAEAQTRYAEFPGNHFTVIDALADPASAMVARVAELAQRSARSRAGMPTRGVGRTTDAANINANPSSVGGSQSLTEDENGGDDADHRDANNAERCGQGRHPPDDREPHGVGDRVAEHAGENDREQRIGVSGTEVKLALEDQHACRDDEERDGDLPTGKADRIGLDARPFQIDRAGRPART